MSNWKPANEAPFDVKLKVKFERDGEIHERKMTRLLPKLWWDEEFSMYAHTNPTKYTEMERL